jgi:hypothetical protein
MSISKIKYIYDTNSFSSGNTSPVSASIIMAFIIIIIFYLSYKIILKDVSYDWDNKRCTPKYIFYSGFLKSISGDPLKDTYTNFIDCTDPTKTPPGGESKFKIVFDTANTIVDTANSILNYSNNIILESDRIKNESKNRLSSSKSKTNILATSVNQLYYYQLKLYTILKIYFERIFLILDTLTVYVTDITLYSLHSLKNQISYNGKQLTIFINYNISEYESIYNNDILSAVASLNKLKKKEQSTDIRDQDYIDFVSKVNNAKDRYTPLYNALIEFDTNNRLKLPQIDSMCTKLQEKKIKYSGIFPLLESKILNPELFNSIDIV